MARRFTTATDEKEKLLVSNGRANAQPADLQCDFPMMNAILSFYSLVEGQVDNTVEQAAKK